MSKRYQLSASFAAGLLWAGLCGAPATAQGEPAPAPAPGGQPAPGDTPPGEGPKDRNVLISKAYEAYRKQSWKDVSDAITQLTEMSGAKPDGRLLYLKAKAFYEQGKTALGRKPGPAAGPPGKGSAAQDSLNSAIDALKELLDKHPDHVEGTYLYAVIEAKNGNLGEAKNRLIRAAARGRYVLHDLASAEGQQTFTNFLKDPEFILDVMNAANEFEISNLKSLRNPFASPIRKVVEEDSGTTTSLDPVVIPKRLQQLEAQIEKIFKELDKLGARQDTEAMSLKFQDLRALMNEYGTDGSELAKEKLASWKQNLARYGDLYLSIQLQIYIQEGNQHLKAMAKALEREEWDLALQRFEDIKTLRDQMQAEERDVFQRNAKALFVRGQTLAAQATRMKKISEFKLRITGIIIAPPENKQQRDSAIIDDRIYYERDHLIDQETEEEIPDLEVIEILKSRVRFRYQGTEFVRGLERPDEKAKKAADAK